AGLLVAWSAVGQQLDAWAYDVLLRLRPPHARPASAVVVALDEETLRANGGMAHLRRPLAEVLPVIAAAGAKGVAVDLQLADRDETELDAALSRNLEATPNLVLSTTLVEDSARKLYWEDPLPEFSRQAVLGHVHADPDLDAVSRQVLLEKAAAGRRRWALALEAFRLASGSPPIVESAEALEIGGLSIPASRREERALRVRYLPSGSLERISAQQLIAHPELAARLRDRAVFIGVTVQGGPDRLMTPYSAGVAMPGVEIHAHLYETLARGDFLVSASHSLSLGLSLALAAAMALSFHKLAGWRAFAVGFGLLVGAHAMPYVWFVRHHVLPAMPEAASAWFCFLGLGTRHYLVTRRKLGVAEAQRDRYQQAVHYVTHEMRTPLTTIQGSSELMGRYALNEEKRKEIAGRINRESRRLARMVEMFLSVERLSAGQLELKREPVSGSEVLATCVERARPLAEAKQIRLRLSGPSRDEDAILGDREFLEYACYNLITNAIKYSPAGTEIHVGVERAGDAVRISVQDQGYGLEEQELKHVFQKFYRTRRAQESGEAGTGIGLALVEEIVVGHGGSIEVESRVNQGSRFTLVLPRAARRVAQTTS
ncbi:MAG: CHASE2 domain-containing protein, partial [Acidobacteria bacterium]|nr:CHASE2 domain-containing protein [Acidobacteriota bacterium]